MNDNNNNNNNKKERVKVDNPYLTKNMVYLMFLVVSIGIIMLSIFVVQHIAFNGTQGKILELLNISLANQGELIENQKLIKNLTIQLTHHESDELAVLEEHLNNSKMNSEKLNYIKDKLDKIFKGVKIQ